jgi:hypothetical protein
LGLEHQLRLSNQLGLADQLDRQHQLRQLNLLGLERQLHQQDQQDPLGLEDLVDQQGQLLEPKLHHQNTKRYCLMYHILIDLELD